MIKYAMIGAMIVFGGAISWVILQLVLFVFSLALGIVWNLFVLVSVFALIGFTGSSIYKLLTK